MGLGKAASIAFGRQGVLDQSSRYESRFFPDSDEMSVATSSGFQATTVAGQRGRFTRTSYLLEVQVETYKV